VTKLPEPTPLGKIRKTKRKIKERRLKDEACYQANKCSHNIVAPD
jgi:hypothetical protein